jgi:outer membrane protein OmpA-like peptidoglycan-associated protein
MLNLKIAGATLMGALSLSACATEDYVNKHVTAEQTRVDTRVDATDARVAAHDTALTTLDQHTREALDRAEAAGKLAEGKFLYSVVLSDDAVKFPLDSSKLSPEAQSRLQEFVQKLKDDNKNVYVEIQGFTDATGSPETNLRLGADRAEAVRRFLNQQGVALNRMATISYGKDTPVAPNNTRAGRAQNRRVVLVVLT